jgi:hypothetical protein
VLVQSLLESLDLDVVAQRLYGCRDGLLGPTIRWNVAARCVYSPLCKTQQCCPRSRRRGSAGRSPHRIRLSAALSNARLISANRRWPARRGRRSSLDPSPSRLMQWLRAIHQFKSGWMERKAIQTKDRRELFSLFSTGSLPGRWGRGTGWPMKAEEPVHRLLANFAA